MPFSPKQPCRQPGCPALVERGYCAKHKPKRKSASARGYGRPWQRLRLAKLTADPVCEVDGCTQAATEVDHKIPLARGGTNDWSNLQSLCKSCHSIKTAREDGSFGRG